MYDWKSFTFTHGCHETREQGMCVMEAVAYIAGEEHSDYPECACPVITGMAIVLNDHCYSDNERNGLLGPLLFRIAGSRGTEEQQQIRNVVALCWLKDKLKVKAKRKRASSIADCYLGWCDRQGLGRKGHKEIARLLSLLCSVGEIKEREFVNTSFEVAQ